MSGLTLRQWRKASARARARRKASETLKAFHAWALEAAPLVEEAARSLIALGDAFGALLLDAPERGR